MNLCVIIIVCNKAGSRDKHALSVLCQLTLETDKSKLEPILGLLNQTRHRVQVFCSFISGTMGRKNGSEERERKDNRYLKVNEGRLLLPRPFFSL